MLGKIYPSWIERTVKEQDQFTGTFVALLLNSNYTFDATDVFISDLTTATNELAAGTGYVRVTPAGLAVTRAGSVTQVTFNTITFPLINASGAGVAARSMILAKVSGGDTTSALVLQQDFEADKNSVSADIVITPSAAGLIRYTSSP